jgi:hypothetical protein
MPLVPSPTTVIIAERVLPGFADDLSTWTENGDIQHYRNPSSNAGPIRSNERLKGPRKNNLVKFHCLRQSAYRWGAFAQHSQRTGYSFSGPNYLKYSGLR